MSKCLNVDTVELDLTMTLEAIQPGDHFRILPLRNWDEWWQLWPKSFRILCWTCLFLAVFQTLVAIRISIGLNEADEIKLLRSHGAQIHFGFDSLEISPIIPPANLRPLFIYIRNHCRILAAGLLGRSAANVDCIFMDHGTDDDLRLIGKHFHNLTHLTFSRSNFSAEMLRSLDGCPEIENLDLSYTDVDDESVKFLDNHSRIRRLRLSATLVTNRCLITLCSMPSLEFVDVWLTEVTADAIRSCRLKRKRLPFQIENGSDEFSKALRGTIRWSDGSRSANFLGSYHLFQEGPLPSSDTQITDAQSTFTDSSSTFFGRNDMSWYSTSEWADGEYRLTLILGDIGSKSVTIRVTNGQPVPDQFEFQMPVTKEIALRLHHE